MEKLYRRNPREWRKGNDSSMDAALARAFDPRAGFRFAELGHEVVGIDLTPEMLELFSDLPEAEGRTLELVDACKRIAAAAHAQEKLDA